MRYVLINRERNYRLISIIFVWKENPAFYWLDLSKTLIIPLLVSITSLKYWHKFLRLWLDLTEKKRTRQTELCAFYFYMNEKRQVFSQPCYAKMLKTKGHAYLIKYKAMSFVFCIRSNDLEESGQLKFNPYSKWSQFPTLDLITYIIYLYVSILNVSTIIILKQYQQSIGI